ncbi:hypothetical protein GMLC_23570 [Geomonas limicola]|uniref:Lipoprotein n=1 Tax=Geomonas limicola TaxID=2740186 RepID=A0A6V8N895_9BACT|nr:hypothetical protein [Geomonas limicola]GFO68778.1 hypothetical protein GMLC_23570 [Geomonas limicola]
MHRLVKNFVTFVIVMFLSVNLYGCATTATQINQWEKTGNVEKLSEVTRDKSERPYIRKISLQSLARLNWKPSNEERLQVYSMFATKSGLQEAEALMQTLNSETFAAIDEKVVACGSLLSRSGSWTDTSKAKTLYDGLLGMDKRAVTISICQQIVARPQLQVQILLLAIKLGIPDSENELVGVLFEYGDKSMAEDFLNSGSQRLSDGGRRWANARGYRVSTGFGSHRSGWGRF